MIAEGCVGMSIHAGCCIIAENQYITVQRTGMYQLVNLQGQIDSFPWRDAVEEMDRLNRISSVTTEWVAQKAGLTAESRGRNSA